METRTRKLHARLDHNITVNATPGHFATNHSHINCYLDMTELKSSQKMAHTGAQLLARQLNAVPVDTILCLEETQVIGAFLAEALANAVHTVNAGSDIHVLTPEVNANNQMIFRDNTQQMVAGKNILLLLTTVTTGKTLRRTLDVLRYYQGNLVGIAALFSFAKRIQNVEIHAIYTPEDLPEYRTYPPEECTMCKERQRMDAIVNSYGYSKL